MRAGNTSLKGCPVLNDFTTLPISSSTFILCEPLYVEDSYEPFFNYIQQSLCFHKVDEVMYTISQCIGKADSSCFDVINGSINKNSGILKKRILSLVFIEEDDIVTEIQKEQEITSNDEDSGSSADECAVHKVLCHSVTNPLLLVEYYYIQKEEEDFNELTKEEIQLIEKELYLPSQSAVNSIFCHTTIWGNLVKVVATMLNLTAFGLTCPLPNVKELDVSYNKLSSLAEICHLFPNLEIMMATFNDIYVLPSVYVSLKTTQLVNLISVNLENNTLETIAELLVLENLKFLSLAGNQISKFGEAQCGKIFKRLEELHLDRNSLVNLEPLELFKMPKLKTLFLQDNHITSLKGIEQLSSLHHLILDRNKINSIALHDVKKFINLKDLYLESNHLHKLDFLPSLKKIIRLFIKNNRIENLDTLRYLKYLTKIQELTFSGNPICRRFESYVNVLSYLPNINYVDGFLIESFSSIESLPLVVQ